MRPSSEPNRLEVDRPAAAISGVSVWSLLVGGLAFLAYLWLAPTVAGDGDSSELTLALVRNGVAHPTGYPLYTLFGHMFVVLFHRLGAPWAYAANAWSALGGAVAIAFMHALGVRLIPPEAPVSNRARHLLALVPVLLFVFNPLWTDVTALTEVYSWHQGWAMSTAFMFVGCLRTIACSPLPQPGGESSGTLRRLAAGWGFLCGVGVSHHLSSILIISSLSATLLLALFRARRCRLSLLAVAALASAIPLLSYASLYIKAQHPGPAVWFRLEPTWTSLLAHVSGQQYQGLLGYFRASASQARSLGRYVYPFLVPALGVMLVAAARSRPSAERMILGGLVAAVAVQLAFCFSYGVPDPMNYFLPPLGLAFVAFGPGLTRGDGGGQRRVAWGAFAVAVVAMAQFGTWLGIAIGRREILVRLDENVRKVWAAIPVQRGIVLWGGDLFHRCNAYQLLQGERRGLRLVSPYELAAPLTPERFTARFGFNPFRAPGGLAVFDRPPRDRGPRYETFLATEAQRLHEATHEPVVLLSPSSDSIRVVGAVPEERTAAASPRPQPTRPLVGSIRKRLPHPLTPTAASEE